RASPRGVARRGRRGLRGPLRDLRRRDGSRRARRHPREGRAMTLVLEPQRFAPWDDPENWWPALTAATHELDAPVGVLAVEALASNAFDLLERAQGMPIRVASKSVRVRGVLDAVLALPGYRGILAYTLPEALWLAETHDDIVVGYPSADRDAIARLAADERLAARVTLMVDSLAQLDLIDA